MATWRSTVTTLAAVLALAGLWALTACTDEGPLDETPPSGRPTQAGPVVIEKAWTSTVRAVETPREAGGSVVFHALASTGGFEMASLNPENGEVRWTAPASPSRVAVGVGLHSELLDDGQTVVWMEPGDDPTDGLVSVVAADADTGSWRWAYGDGALALFSSPNVCQDGQAVCLTAYDAGTDTSVRTVLDGKTGQIRNRTAFPGGSSRDIGDNLHDEGTRLAAYTDAGERRWAKPSSEVFTGLDVSPDYGWSVWLQDDLYVASLGYPDLDLLEASRNGTPLTFEAKGSATAGFSAATGDTVWLRPDASLQCAAVEFDGGHPVRCVLSGTYYFDGERVVPELSSVEITFEGFDFATGETTWTWDAGALPALTSDNPSAGVLRIDDLRYTIQVNGQVTLLDLDQGPVVGEEAPTAGWCGSAEYRDPGYRVSGHEGAPGYLASGWFPCSADGPLELPATAPGFAGGQVGESFVWQNDEGFVRGGRVS